MTSTSVSQARAKTVLTQRLTLRPLRSDDLAWLTALFSDSRVTTYLATGDLQGEPARAFAAEFIDNSVSEFDSFGCGAMAIVRQQDNREVGYAGLRALPDRYNVVELIYAIEVNCWGIGFAQEVAKALLAWGFQRYPEMIEIIAMARSENVASIAVMEKSGMRHRGRNELYYDEPLELYSTRRTDLVN